MCTLAQPVCSCWVSSHKHCCWYMYSTQTTVLAVLDAMMEPHEGDPGSYIVYYNILESDQHGRDPNHPKFSGSEKSCLYKIAKSNNKVIGKLQYLHV